MISCAVRLLCGAASAMLDRTGKRRVRRCIGAVGVAVAGTGTGTGQRD